MEKIIKKSFETMCERYIKTLKYYPARDSSGFTEQNQVHIYLNSLVGSLDDEDTFQWLECPWENKREHIDAIVYSPKQKSVFYIEAKRFSTKSKTYSLARDISRVVNCNRDFIKEYEIENVEQEYVIALSDIWLETKWKRSIPSWWLGEEIPMQVLNWNKKTTEILSQSSDSFHNLLNCSEYNVDWSDAKKYIYWLGEKVSKVENYCLLMGAKKI